MRSKGPPPDEYVLRREKWQLSVRPLADALGLIFGSRPSAAILPALVYFQQELGDRKPLLKWVHDKLSKLTKSSPNSGFIWIEPGGVLDAATAMVRFSYESSLMSAHTDTRRIQQRVSFEETDVDLGHLTTLYALTKYARWHVTGSHDRFTVHEYGNSGNVVAIFPTAAGRPAAQAAAELLVNLHGGLIGILRDLRRYRQLQLDLDIERLKKEKRDIT